MRVASALLSAGFLLHCVHAIVYAVRTDNNDTEPRHRGATSAEDISGSGSSVVDARSPQDKRDCSDSGGVWSYLHQSSSSFVERVKPAARSADPTTIIIILIGIAIPLIVVLWNCLGRGGQATRELPRYGTGDRDMERQASSRSSTRSSGDSYIDRDSSPSHNNKERGGRQLLVPGAQNGGKKSNLNKLESRFFEVVDSVEEQGESQPFPDGAGPFQLKGTADIRAADLVCSMPEEPLEQVSSWTITLANTADPVKVRKTTKLCNKVSDDTVEGAMSPMRKVNLSDATKVYLGIPDSAVYFAWSYAVPREETSALFFVIPDIKGGNDSDQESYGDSVGDDKDDEKHDTKDEPHPKKAAADDKDGGTSMLKRESHIAAESHFVDFDSDVAFIHHGGFVYLDDNFKVVLILALMPHPQGSLRFGPPKKWHTQWTDQFESAGRFKPITIAALKAKRAKKVCWIMPGESVEDPNDEDGVIQICPKGGFAYLIE